MFYWQSFSSDQFFKSSTHIRLQNKNQFSLQEVSQRDSIAQVVAAASRWLSTICGFWALFCTQCKCKCKCFESSSWHFMLSFAGARLNQSKIESWFYWERWITIYFLSTTPTRCACSPHQPCARLCSLLVHVAKKVISLELPLIGPSLPRLPGSSHLIYHLINHYIDLATWHSQFLCPDWFQTW